MIAYCTTHCSATPPSVNYTVEQLTADHKARGFRTIGYHWYITRDGMRHKGRNELELGAHVSGHNNYNIGICLEGGVNEQGKTEDNFTEAQWDEWILLVKEIQGRHRLGLDKFKGHRDWSPDLNGDGTIQASERIKECPCFDVRDKLKELLG